jgi:hypothetical protein
MTISDKIRKKRYDKAKQVKINADKSKGNTNKRCSDFNNTQALIESN